MASARLLYIESDGQVYLVRRGGLLSFPSEDEDLAFGYSVRHATRIGGVDVAFCRPELDHFPQEWVFKDEIPMRLDIDPIVQRAINASLPRCVCGVLLLDQRQQVLLVKSSRGFTKGMWNVPGGFIEYGESPEVAAVRETKEETGLDIRLGSLLGVFMERFESPYFMYGFMFDAVATGGELRANPSEIEEMQWFTPQEAMRATINPFALQAMSRRFDQPLPRSLLERHRRASP